MSVELKIIFNVFGSMYYKQRGPLFAFRFQEDKQEIDEESNIKQHAFVNL